MPVDVYLSIPLLKCKQMSPENISTRSQSTHSRSGLGKDRIKVSNPVGSLGLGFASPGIVHYGIKKNATILSEKCHLTAKYFTKGISGIEVEEDEITCRDRARDVIR